MKVKWLELGTRIPTCIDLGKEVGIEVKSIAHGGIRVGGSDNAPIFEKGIEIEVDAIPDGKVLSKLDSIFLNYKREGVGARDLVKEIEFIGRIILNLKEYV